MQTGPLNAAPISTSQDATCIHSGESSQVREYPRRKGCVATSSSTILTSERRTIEGELATSLTSSEPKINHVERRPQRTYASQLSGSPEGDPSLSCGVPYIVNISLPDERYTKSYCMECNTAMRESGFSGCHIEKSDIVSVHKDGPKARRVQLRCATLHCRWSIMALALIQSDVQVASFRVSSWPNTSHLSDECRISVTRSSETPNKESETEFTHLRDYPAQAARLARQWLHSDDPVFRMSAGNTEVARSMTMLLETLGFDVKVSPDQVSDL